MPWPFTWPGQPPTPVPTGAVPAALASGYPYTLPGSPPAAAEVPIGVAPSLSEHGSAVPIGGGPSWAGPAGEYPTGPGGQVGTPDYTSPEQAAQALYHHFSPPALTKPQYISLCQQLTNAGQTGGSWGETLHLLYQQWITAGRPGPSFYNWASVQISIGNTPGSTPFPVMPTPAPATQNGIPNPGLPTQGSPPPPSTMQQPPTPPTMTPAPTQGLPVQGPPRPPRQRPWIAGTLAGLAKGFLIGHGIDAAVVVIANELGIYIPAQGNQNPFLPPLRPWSDFGFPNPFPPGYGSLPPPLIGSLQGQFMGGPSNAFIDPSTPLLPWLRPLPPHYTTDTGGGDAFVRGGGGGGSGGSSI